MSATPRSGRRGRPRFVATWSALVAVSSLVGHPARAQSTFSVAVDPEGNPANGWCGVSKLSADGLVVAYSSRATNLVPGDTNGFADIFTFERASGRVRRVSVDSAGNEANQDSSMFLGSVSSDGRHVAFWSHASNLCPGDTNGTADVFVHDTLTGVTTCASVTPAGVPGDGWSWIPRISGDGRLLAFATFATDLVAGANSSGQVVVRDLVTGSSRVVSADAAGLLGNDESDTPWISADGRYVAFDSLATNLSPLDLNLDRDVYVKDLLTGALELVSVSPLGVAAIGYSANPSLSADGRFVSFASSARDLVPGDVNGLGDVFVRDRLAGTTELVSVSSAGVQADNHCLGNSAVSADGAVVVFDSYAANLAPNDPQSELDVFVRDRAAGTTALVSVGYLGTSVNGAAADPSLSADGRYITYSSRGAEIVQGHGNFDWDPYFHDRLGLTPMLATYCAPTATSDGCLPQISAFGVPRAANSGFTLSVVAAPAQRLGLVFYGVTGARHIPYGVGASVLCIQHPLQRTPIQATGGTPGLCDGTLSVDWNQFVSTQVAPVGTPFLGGRTVWAQAWVRDPGAPDGAVLTDAVWFTVCP